MIGIGLKDFPATLAALGWVTGYCVSTRHAVDWNPLIEMCSSYGYHGDDGHIYAQSAIGRKWGPTFTSGDIIGTIITSENVLLLEAYFIP